MDSNVCSLTRGSGLGISCHKGLRTLAPHRDDRRERRQPATRLQLERRLLGNDPGRLRAAQSARRRAYPHRLAGIMAVAGQDPGLLC